MTEMQFILFLELQRVIKKLRLLTIKKINKNQKLKKKKTTQALDKLLC